MNILPEFITLSERTREYRFLLPFIPSYSARHSSDGPADLVQCIAVYKYKYEVRKDMHQFELEGVEIIDTRLSTLQEKYDQLRAEIARLRECVRLSEIYITSLEDFIVGETSFFVSEIRSLVDEKQAYTRAREAVG